MSQCYIVLMLLTYPGVRLLTRYIEKQYMVSLNDFLVDGS